MKSCADRHPRLLATAIALAGALFLGALASSDSRAQDAELRPVPPQPEEPAPAEEADEPDPLDAELDKLTEGLGDAGPAAEITRLAGEIRDNMKKIEELLNRRQTGAETQGAQTSTIEQIDKLIELVESACSGSAGGSGSTSGSKSSASQEQDQRRAGKQRQTSQLERPAGEEPKPRPEQAGERPEDSDAQTRNDRTSEGDMPPDEAGDLRDREGRGRWGRLPRTEIEKMYDNGRRQLPEKYRILLEDYFRRLPTDGQ
jgi:hypothetical protein